MIDHELPIVATRLRKRMLRAIATAGAGHTGGGLSSLDILTVLYYRVLRITPESAAHPERDRYVQSKGHCVEALYTVLASRAFFPDGELDTLCRFQSEYVGHPTRKVRGVEMNTGALGHGLSISVGMALAAKRDSAGFRVFTLLGDGELAEGSIWEAALAGAHYRLNNLTAIVDQNALQISGPTQEVMATEPLESKWRAFGWEAVSVDGHDHAALTEVLGGGRPADRPLVVVARTTKGKGVSFMEDVASWHHRVPTERELAEATAELDATEARLLEAAL